MTVSDSSTVSFNNMGLARVESDICVIQVMSHLLTTFRLSLTSHEFYALAGSVRETRPHHNRTACQHGFASTGAVDRMGATPCTPVMTFRSVSGRVVTGGVVQGGWLICRDRRAEPESR